MAGQRLMGARCSRGERFSMAAAEVRAAKAAKAKVVNCIVVCWPVGLERSWRVVWELLMDGWMDELLMCSGLDVMLDEGRILIRSFHLYLCQQQCGHSYQSRQLTSVRENDQG